MTFKTIFSFFLFPLTLLIFSSCAKECDFPEDTATGEIVPNSSLFVGNSGGQRLVIRDSVATFDIKVSFDKGFSYVPVDFTKYSILNYPVTVGCNTFFQRDVTFVPTESKAVYTLKRESCPDCEDQYLIDNWVLVNKIPDNYQVVYEK